MSDSKIILGAKEILEEFEKLDLNIGFTRLDQVIVHILKNYSSAAVFEETDWQKKCHAISKICLKLDTHRKKAIELNEFEIRRRQKEYIKQSSAACLEKIQKEKEEFKIKQLNAITYA